MKDFGYALSKSSAIILNDSADGKFSELVAQEPDVMRCISCGSCAASCTAAAFTPLSLRRVMLSLQRGPSKEALQQIKGCMLCGKCTLVCPRGLNTRRIILNVLKLYKEE